jgi:hypothetical protein
MPLGVRPMAQTGDDRSIDVFRVRLDASGAPELNTKPRVSSRGLEITQKVERACTAQVEDRSDIWMANARRRAGLA